MYIPIDKIRELRNLTGSGVLVCKEALLKSGGSVAEALSLLRSTHKIFALKKIGREMRFGAVFSAISDNYKVGACVELTCETDFVAKSSFFVDAVKLLSKHAVANSIKTLEELLQSRLSEEMSVESFRLDLVNRFSENIDITNLIYVQEFSGCVGVYNHYRNNIPYISTLVRIDTNKHILAHDIAVQIAVSQPKYYTYTDISSLVLDAEINKSRTFLYQKYKDKSKHVFDDIVENSVKKALCVDVLDEQFFIKNTAIKVKDILRAEQTNVLFFYLLGVGL